MKHIICVLLFLLANGLSRVAWAKPNALDTVNRALDAMGGAKAVGQIKTITIKGQARHWEPEQSVIPGGEMLLLGDSTFVQHRDFGSGAVRTEWQRKLVVPSPREYNFTEIIAGGAGYVQGIDSAARTKQSLSSNPPEHAMSGLSVAAASRELQRASPLLLLEMRANPRKLTALPDQGVGGKRLSAIKYQSAERVFTVMFDQSMGLPSLIRTLDYDNIHGDSNFDLVLTEWKDVAGVKIAHKQVYRLNDRDIVQTRLDEVIVNPSLAAGQFEIPVAVKAKAAKAATGNVPYQWVLRRQYLGIYLDSDKVNYDPEALSSLKLADLAPGVSQVVGGTHNSLIVEMDKYLVVFDAPINEWQSKWTIAAAKAKYPRKPIKYLVLSHHHMDHTGGARTYVAEGATVVVGAGNVEYFKKAFSAPHKVDKDALQQKPRKANIIEVPEIKVLSDGKRDLRVYLVESRHSAGMLIGYVVDVKLGFVVDMWSPGRDKLGDKPTPGQADLVAAVKKAGISPERFAGGHGTVGNYAELEALAAKSQ